MSEQPEQSAEVLLATLVPQPDPHISPRGEDGHVVAVEMRNISKYFKTFLAVDRLSLQVRKGEIFGLLGTDSAGKTTLLRMISGLSIPTRGELEVLGNQLPRDVRQVRRNVSFVPQQNVFYEELSAWDNLDFHASLLGIARKEKEQRINSILMLLQLSEYRAAPLTTFSYSMKRRLVLGRALLTNPHLLCLDEPTLGVDIRSRRDVWDYILALRILGKTTIVATNALDEALELCDRIAILDHGKLTTIETPEQIKRAYGDIVVELEMALPCSTIHVLQVMTGIQSVKQDGLHLQVIIQDNRHILPQVIALLTQDNEIKAINVRELLLSEIFPHLQTQA